MQLTAEEFIRRFLQHVLPSGFQKVRHYGFAHPRSKIELEWLKMLVTATLNLVYELIVAPRPLPVVYQPTCPHCGADLRRVALISAGVRHFKLQTTAEQGLIANYTQFRRRLKFEVPDP